MKKIIAFVLVLIALLLLNSCDETYYYKSVGWNVSVQDFNQNYIPHYKEQLSLLAEKYSLSHQSIVDITNQATAVLYETYLYNEEYTIKIIIRNEVELATYKITLYYYGSEMNNVDDYNTQKDSVNFINDFTNYVAYDSISEENKFEMLWQKAHMEEDLKASDRCHYDSLVGNIGYIVTLNDMYSGYYYMMQKNEDVNLICNTYSFSGLLKPLQ